MSPTRRIPASQPSVSRMMDDTAMTIKAGVHIRLNIDLVLMMAPLIASAEHIPTAVIRPATRLRPGREETVSETRDVACGAATRMISPPARPSSQRQNWPANQFPLRIAGAAAAAGARFAAEISAAGICKSKTK